MARDVSKPEDRRPPALVVDLFPKSPPSVLIGVVKDLVAAEPGHPRPDDDPPSAA
jgi:hypothetical protein